MHVCEQARATLEEFEASITKDSVKHPPPDGTVHPLAAYTLSFLKRLFAYEATIDTLFSDEENEVILAVLTAEPTSCFWLHVLPWCIYFGSLYQAGLSVTNRAVPPHQP